MLSTLLLILQFQLAFPMPPGVEVQWATPAHFDGSTPFCRGYYDAVRTELNGDGWWTDYPRTDRNFIFRARELTKLNMGAAVVVRMDSPLLTRCPMLYMEDVGTIGLQESDINGLRAYLDRGGFLWVDDFWGTAAWDHWEMQFRKVYPNAIWRAMPSTHPIRSMLYSTPEIPQIPATGFWPTTTSERGADSQYVNFRGMWDQRDRLIAVATHNTDIADAFDEEYQDQAFWLEFGSKGRAVGINILLYALTH